MSGVKIMADNRYKIIMDLEATCWNDNSFRWVDQEIIEIGAVLWDQETDDCEFFRALCRPFLHRRLSKFCKELTGLRQEDIDAAEPFLFAYTSLLKEMSLFLNINSPESAKYSPLESFQFMSWGDWDIKQLMLDCARRNIVFPFNLYTAVNIKDFFWTTHEDQTGRRGLAQALDLLGSKFVGTSHCALYDAINAFVVYRLAIGLKNDSINDKLSRLVTRGTIL